jgi:diguanylate cyclase (GGDEF)-like protein
VTAPSLPIPSVSIASGFQQVRSRASRQVATGAAIGIVGAAIGLALARSADPALVAVLAVAIAGTLAGVRAATLAAVIGLVAVILVPTPLADPGVIRLLVTASGLALAVALTTGMAAPMQRRTPSADRSGPAGDLVETFASGLGDERPEQLPDLILQRVAGMVNGEMAALTILDPRTGRHHVRAVRGTTRAALGVEVLPGVGIAGQAMRDRQLVANGRQAAPSPLRSLLTRFPLPGGAASPADAGARGAPAMAVPMLHGGVVVATITVGRRRDARPFTAAERQLIERVAPQAGLAVANAMLRQQLNEASLIDPLTGLYNRAFLDATLSQLLALRRRAPAADRQPLSLVLFDVDGFVALNEQHGEAAGDEVLRSVAALLQARFRASDTIARVGGDGFFVVLDSADTGQAMEAAAQIRAQVRQLALVDQAGAPIRISVSAGVAMFRDEVARGETLVRTVEAALDTARWSAPGSIVAV